MIVLYCTDCNDPGLPISWSCTVLYVHSCFLTIQILFGEIRPNQIVRLNEYFFLGYWYSTAKRK